MKKKSFISVITIVCLLNVLCTTSKSESSFTNRIDSFLNEHYTDDAPGCALIICKGDTVLYEGVRGLADVNTKEKINENTSFNIASITKQFTVVAILKLQEKGLLSIEDSVAKYFPEFKSDIWRKVKIKHLMSHSSGVPDKRPRVDKDFMLHIDDAQCLEYMVDLDELKFEPGTYYDYKNPTFQILAEIVAKVSGVNFEEFQQKNLFDPALMTNIRYFSPELCIDNIAHGYINISQADKDSVDSDSQKDKGDLLAEYTDINGQSWMEFDYDEETFFGTKADGGIYTSIRDFMKWEFALLNNSVITNETKILAYSPHILVSGSEYSSYQNRPYTYYGYGWFIDTTPGRSVKIYHTGDNGGFQAYAAKYPQCGISVTMFENRNDIDRWLFQTKLEDILIEEGLVLTNIL